MELSTSDKLAIERTKLAIERTFLAYFRSAIVFSSSGFAIIQLEVLQKVTWIGYALIIIGPILLFVGLFRLVQAKRRIREYYRL